MGALAEQHRHFFTVDLEEYFQVLAFAQVVSADEWHRYPPRAEAATDRLLELLEKHDGAPRRGRGARIPARTPSG